MGPSSCCIPGCWNSRDQQGPAGRAGMCCTHRSQGWRFQLSAEVFAQPNNHIPPHSPYLQLTEWEQLRQGSLKMLLAQSWAGSEPWICSSHLHAGAELLLFPWVSSPRVLTGLCFPGDSICSCLCNPHRTAGYSPAAGRDVFHGITESIMLERTCKIRESNL